MSAVERLRQIAANAASKNFVSHMSDEEIGAALYGQGDSMQYCRTAAQQQGYRQEAKRAREILRREWYAAEEAGQ